MLWLSGHELTLIRIWLRLPKLHGHTDRECCANTLGALDSNPSSHQCAQALANGQAESCSAVLSRGGRLSLHKFTKQPGKLFRRHADAVIRDLQYQLRDALLGLQ